MCTLSHDGNRCYDHTIALTRTAHAAHRTTPSDETLTALRDALINLATTGRGAREIRHHRNRYPSALDIDWLLTIGDYHRARLTARARINAAHGDPEAATGTLDDEPLDRIIRDAITEALADHTITNPTQALPPVKHYTTQRDKQRSQQWWRNTLRAAAISYREAVTATTMAESALRGLNEAPRTELHGTATRTHTWCITNQKQRAADVLYAGHKLRIAESRQLG